MAMTNTTIRVAVDRPEWTRYYYDVPVNYDMSIEEMKQAAIGAIQNGDAMERGTKVLGNVESMEEEMIFDDMVRSVAEERFRTSFMKPEVITTNYASIETTHGTEIVLDFKRGATAGEMRDYLTGDPLDPDEVPEPKIGILARMSASGCMDCTEWTAFSCEQDAFEYLIEHYAPQEG